MQSIKTAILSFGMSGKLFHAPFIDVNPHFELYGVWERSKNLAQEVYPKIKTFRTLEDLLTDKEIELIIVNTPNATHYEYAKAALNAGKHVIVEKPFVVHSEQGEELIALAEEKNLKLSVYQNRRYDSGYLTLKNLLDQNALGKIAEAEFHFDRYKEELSYKLHKEIPQVGNGIVYDLGAHLIDQALQLFGMPDALFADIDIMRSISQVDDYFEIVFFYPQMRVRLKGTYVAREPIPGYVVHGSKGSFLKSTADVQEAALMKGIKPSGDDWGKEPESEQGLLHTEINGEVIKKNIPTAQGNYMKYFEGIANALKENTSLPVTAEEGLNVIRIIEAAYKSNREKRTVTIAE